MRFGGRRGRTRSARHALTRAPSSAAAKTASISPALAAAQRRRSTSRDPSPPKSADPPVCTHARLTARRSAPALPPASLRATAAAPSCRSSGSLAALSSSPCREGDGVDPCFLGCMPSASLPASFSASPAPRLLRIQDSPQPPRRRICADPLLPDSNCRVSAAHGPIDELCAANTRTKTSCTPPCALGGPGGHSSPKADTEVETDVGVQCDIRIARANTCETRPRQCPRMITTRPRARESRVVSCSVTRALRGPAVKALSQIPAEHAAQARLGQVRAPDHRTSQVWLHLGIHKHRTLQAIRLPQTRSRCRNRCEQC